MNFIARPDHLGSYRRVNCSPCGLPLCQRPENGNYVKTSLSWKWHKVITIFCIDPKIRHNIVKKKKLSLSLSLCPSIHIAQNFNENFHSLFTFKGFSRQYCQRLAANKNWR